MGHTNLSESLGSNSRDVRTRMQSIAVSEVVSYVPLVTLPDSLSVRYTGLID